MMVAFVVDANVIHAFQCERISGVADSASASISAIQNSHVIALDNQKLCYAEWVACAGGSFPFALTDWIGDQLISGKIEMFDLAPNTCRQHLITLGLPAKDHKWIRLAIGCSGRRIVTEDIDFFDPRLKTASMKVKTATKDSRSGSCARALKQKYDISVMCLRHVNDELLSIAEGM